VYKYAARELYQDVLLAAVLPWCGLSRELVDVLGLGLCWNLSWFLSGDVHPIGRHELSSYTTPVRSTYVYNFL
jgi:hypothetical protein